MNVNNSLGLNLINSYSDDSDIEEDANEFQNVDIPRVIESSLFEDKPIVKSEESTDCGRLPLPSSIGQLFTKDIRNKDPEDNPDLHNGRIRSFPHQRGNWSTYVYIPFDPDEGFSGLISCLQTSASQRGVELQHVDEPHISLTRTVVLLHHWIDGFISSVRLRIGHLCRFHVQLGVPAVYCNEERTRTFLGLRAHSGSKQLLETTHALDECLAEFRLPPFYKDPSFHMSVLWIVGDFQQTLEDMLPHLSSEMDNHLVRHPHKMHIDVAKCFCKTGKKTFVFPLST